MRAKSGKPVDLHRQSAMISDFSPAILDALGFGVILIEADTHKIVYMNSRILEMSGYMRKDIIGQICHTLLCPAARGQCPITDIGQAIDNSDRELLRSDGTFLPIIKTAVTINLGGTDYLIESVIDNSERKKIQEELKETNEKLEDEIVERERIQEQFTQLAYHDFLTGLPNRLLFTQQLDHSIALASRSEKILAILFLDLDGFKVINDTMGHDVGDQILVEISKELVQSLRKSDTVARIGGDEFIIMIENVEDVESIRVIAEKILNRINKTLLINKQECFLSTSIGVAVYPTDGEDAERLIKNADIAMYKAKEKGRNQYAFCSPVMKDKVMETLKLTNSLYRALDRNELELYYQPQISCATDKIVGLEALIRWNHPELGMVSPMDFIPIAEHTGLIHPIGEWVIKTACLQNKKWQDAGLPGIRIGVNLSVYQFSNPNIVKQVEDILRTTGLEPKYLELEITESAAMKDTGYIVNILEGFKRLGVSLAIDDFGTEYSSLSYLKQLPVDRIKMAMPFVHSIGVSDKDEAIAKAIIILAKNMGLGIVAEGVETETQLTFLTKRMCDEIQGFYYFKPMPKDDVEALLKNS